MCILLYILKICLDFTSLNLQFLVQVTIKMKFMNTTTIYCLRNSVHLGAGLVDLGGREKIDFRNSTLSTCLLLGTPKMRMDLCERMGKGHFLQIEIQYASFGLLHVKYFHIR